MEPTIIAIIDAKMKLTPHSVAQIIGYYSAFNFNTMPVVALISATEIQLVLFPFTDRSGSSLVNALVLDQIPLWKERLPDMEALKLFVSLLGQNSHLRKYEVFGKFIPVKGRVLKSNLKITTFNKALSDLENSLLRENKRKRDNKRKLQDVYRVLERERKDHKKQLKKLEKKLERLECNEPPMKKQKNNG